MHQPVDFAQFEPSAHPGTTDHERVVLPTLSAWIDTQSLKSRQHGGVEPPTKPVLIEQHSLCRDNLGFRTSGNELPKQTARWFSPERLNCLKAAFSTDSLHPSLMGVEEDVSEYHMRKSTSC